MVYFFSAILPLHDRNIDYSLPRSTQFCAQSSRSSFSLTSRRKKTSDNGAAVINMSIWLLKGLFHSLFDLEALVSLIRSLGKIVSYTSQLKHVFQLKEECLQVVLLELRHIFVPASVKQTIFSQFIIFFLSFSWEV